MVPTDQAVVDGALTCFDCLYDLRGQPTDGVCPECGAAVAGSLRDDRWDRADARWRRRVTRGLAMLSAEYFWLFAGVVASLVPAARGEAMFATVFGGMGVWALASGWVMTAAEPGRPAARWRATVRALSVVAALAYAGFVVAMLWFDGVYFRIPLLPVAMVAMALANGAKQGAQLSYLTKLLERVPGRPLRNVSRFAPALPVLGWWVPGAAVLWSFAANASVNLSGLITMTSLVSFLATTAYAAWASEVLRRRSR